MRLLRAGQRGAPPLNRALGGKDGSARHEITPEQLVRDFCAREAPFFG
jgi:hypothetical protein